MNSDKLKNFLSQNLMRLVFLMTSIIVVVPIAWAFISSFKTSAEYLSDPWGLPSALHWENYVNAFVRANMGEYFVNTIFTTACALVLLFCLAVPAAYALSRFRFRFSGTINLAIMGGLFVNSTFIVVPLFLLLKDVHLLDNRLALSVVYAASSLPFNIYLLSGFMKGLPKEYEEAACIDGCGYFGTLVRIVVPMSKPGLVTAAMFGFMSFWNEYMLSLTLMTTPEKRTLSVGLKNLMEIQKFATDWGAMFAGLVIVMIPTMIFYALVQDKLIAGISLGGLKG